MLDQNKEKNEKDMIIADIYIYIYKINKNLINS